MDVYVCIKEVEYGRIKFSPDAKDEKNRILRLPENTPIDNTIKTCFKKQGPPVEAEKPKESTMSEKSVLGQIPDPMDYIKNKTMKHKKGGYKK